MVTTGNIMYITDFNSKLFLGVYLKSVSMWDGTVTWTVYNSSGRIAVQSTQTCLPGSEPARWEERGVPPLKPWEIFLDTATTPAVPREDAIFEYNTGIIVKMLKSQLLAFECKIIKGLLNLKFANLMNKMVKVALYDIRGRLLQSWNSVMVNNGSVELTMPLQAKGCVVLRVYAGSEMYQKKIMLVR